MSERNLFEHANVNEYEFNDGSIIKFADPYLKEDPDGARIVLAIGPNGEVIHDKDGKRMFLTMEEAAQRMFQFGIGPYQDFPPTLEEEVNDLILGKHGCITDLSGELVSKVIKFVQEKLDRQKAMFEASQI